jgi:hypothetical protein
MACFLVSPSRWPAMGKFQPGQSGNPGGRPKGVAEVMALARTYAKEAVETLAGIMRNDKAPSAARVAAANGLLDRGYGKPPAGAGALQQRRCASGSDGHPPSARRASRSPRGRRTAALSGMMPWPSSMPLL